MAASKPGVSFEKEPLRYLDQILPTVGDAFWLSRGSLIVADATAAKAVLANEDHLYQEHSDFFHTRRGQFGPRTVQVEMGRTARRMLRDHLTAQRPALPETLSRVLGSESEWPEAANRLIEAHLGPVVLSPESPEWLRSLVGAVVDRGVLAGAPARHSWLSRTLFRRRLMRGLASAVRERRAAGRPEPIDLLDVVTQTALPEATELELAEIYLSFLFAAVGSVGFALAWSVYLMGRHPEAEPRPAWVVREALRLFPVAWFLSRQPARPHEVAGEAVTPRDDVVVCPYVTHRHPRHWREPNRYWPERWADGGDHPAFLPFGWGRHTCAAAALTLELVEEVLATLLESYRPTIEVRSERPFLGPALAPPPFCLRLERQCREYSERERGGETHGEAGSGSEDGPVRPHAEDPRALPLVLLPAHLELCRGAAHRQLTHLEGGEAYGEDRSGFDDGAFGPSTEDRLSLPLVLLPARLERSRRPALRQPTHLEGGEANGEDRSSLDDCILRPYSQDDRALPLVLVPAHLVLVGSSGAPSRPRASGGGSMEGVTEEDDFVRDLRARCDGGGGVFWIREGELAVLDPEAAQKVNAVNFEDLTLPDRLVDLLRRRKSRPVSWKQVRNAWTVQLRRICDAEGHRQLAERMAKLLDERAGQHRDLIWALQEVTTRSLVPVVIADLSAHDTDRIVADETFKLTRLLSTQLFQETFWQRIATTLIQIRAGLVARRELRGRARGKRPRRLDLTDPVVDLLPELGMDRAVDAVTAVLTAIAGPPGSTACCLAYELARHPEWASRLEAELAAVPLAELYEAPTRSAPLTNRFVKETLRMWSPPLVLTRTARVPIELDEAKLEVGQFFHVSTFFLHHDHRNWQDADVFDPDRWLPEAPRGACPGHAYVPFGWHPTACVGAGLGTTQLILLAHLLSTRFRLVPKNLEAVSMALASVPVPRGFEGTIERR